MRTDRQIGRSTTASQTGRQQRTHYGGWKSYSKQTGLDEEKRLGWTVLFMSFDVPLAVARPGGGVGCCADYQNSSDFKMR